jgi:16S rRNA (cytosine967-C5)-methyltransferase
MRMGGRASAAIEILSEIFNRHRPAADALKDWGRAHRFAGGADRSAIGNLVYDALRWRASLSHRMKSDAPRALVLGVLGLHWDRSVEELDALARSDHGPGALSGEEQSNLRSLPDHAAPPWVKGDYPQWLDDSLARVLGDRRAAQGAALAERAPVDLRANSLKATPEKLMASLARYRPAPGELAPLCVRLAPPAREARNPNIEAEPAHGKGWFEIQDQGSQIAAALSAAAPQEQVADICAGAGGKTLALAAMMANRGQIHAYDADRHRLRPIFERLQRAGARNVQVVPADEPERLDQLRGKLDLVVVDAPCSGSGSWRRKPDAKWRLKPESLRLRIAEQERLLARAAQLLRPEGRLHYITCSLLPEENADRIDTFLRDNAGFERLAYGETWRRLLKGEPPPSADGDTQTLLLTPLDHKTDGFFIATLKRRPS